MWQIALFLLVATTLAFGFDQHSHLHHPENARVLKGSSRHSAHSLHARSKYLQSRSNDDGNQCYQVCSGSTNNTSGNGTVIYVSESGSIIGFYASSLSYFLVVDVSSAIILIGNTQNDTSAIFNLQNGIGYYVNGSISAEGIYNGSTSIQAYFESITSLETTFEIYRQHGISFSIEEIGVIVGSAEIHAFFAGFYRVVFRLEVLSLAYWRFFVHAASEWVIYAFEHRSGIFTISTTIIEIISEVVVRGFLAFLRAVGQANTLGSSIGSLITNLLRTLQITISSEIIGFFQSITLAASINVSAAHNATLSANGTFDLSVYLNSDASITEQQFNATLQSVPGLREFLYVCVEASGNGSISWAAVFRFFYFQVVVGRVQGLYRLAQLIEQNARLLVVFGETVAEVVRAAFQAVLSFEGSVSVEGGGSGSVSVSSQSRNGFHKAVHARENKLHERIAQNKLHNSVQHF